MAGVSTSPSGGVPSVFARTGAVVATSGDYTAAQVTNAFDKSANQTFGNDLTINGGGRIIQTGGGTIGTTGTVQAAGGILNPITSGALSTISPVSTTGLQVSTARDVFLMQTVTLNPTAGAAATCVVAISPDNVTFSTLITVTSPAGVALDGIIPPIFLSVPKSWYVKFTTTNATLGTGTWY